MIGRRGQLAKIRGVHNPRCRHCTLHRSSDHVCIVGRGNPLANVVLLGEAPGANEALTGKVFSGQCGRLLNDVLRELQILDKVWITNVVKCRPPHNRNPTDNEIAKCGRYIIAEMDIIRPRAVLIMGNVAFNALGFSRKDYTRGSCWFHQSLLFPHGTNMRFGYHPAYCMRCGHNGRRVLRRQLEWVKNWTKDRQ